MRQLNGESGYAAWLRYPYEENAQRRGQLACLAQAGIPTDSGIAASAYAEWQLAIAGWTGQAAAAKGSAGDGAKVAFVVDASLHPETFKVGHADGRLVIRGGDDRGLLYGVFTVLRELQLGADPDDLTMNSGPASSIRMLNHWDNPVEDPVMGSIERVWGGKTIFDWTDLARPNPRYRDYARLLASVGINAVCINNVNATPEILESRMLSGIAALAGVLRHWGIRLYLSIHFSTPVELGGLTTADPLDAKVQAWWTAKVDEIYALIPDFGGFVVKADSEGRPGPGDYGRSHIEGSQCLAVPLARHGGTLFWRAFVYGRDISERAPHERAVRDRANHASYEFIHLDGCFADNVILQIKCSATDFQIWEPAHALFGRMPNTRLALEFGLAHEYTGHDIDVAYYGPYMNTVLDFEVEPGEASSTVANVVAGRYKCQRSGAMVGVSNVCNARNWFGHLLHGADLYAFGRLAWDPRLRSASLSREYSQLMFGEAAAGRVSALLDHSYDAVASYTSPLGLGNLYEHLHHHEPDPWENCTQAGITADGAGRDRTRTSGSAHTGLYADANARIFEDPATCLKRNLLYFHHLPWSFPLRDGRPLIQALYDELFAGVEAVATMRCDWLELRELIDPDRWAHVYEKLGLQLDHAERWRDLLARFFFEKSGKADVLGRICADTPSPHARIRSGFGQAVQDYLARVARMREHIQAHPSNHADYD